MKYLIKAMAAIMLIPFGLCGACLAASSLLSVWGVPIMDLLYSPEGWVAQSVTYCGWMVGGIMVFSAYFGLVWTLKGSQGVREAIDKLPNDAA